VSFTVLLHPKAAKELNKTQKTIKDRIIERAKELRENPDKLGKSLRPTTFWSTKTGEHRIIYEIDAKENRVTILFVEHRSKVYDDFSKML